MDRRSLFSAASVASSALRVEMTAGDQYVLGPGGAAALHCTSQLFQ